MRTSVCSRKAGSHLCAVGGPEPREVVGVVVGQLQEALKVPAAVVGTLYRAAKAVKLRTSSATPSSTDAVNRRTRSCWEQQKHKEKL